MNSMTHNADNIYKGNVFLEYPILMWLSSHIPIVPNRIASTYIDHLPYKTARTMTAAYTMPDAALTKNLCINYLEFRIENLKLFLIDNFEFRIDSYYCIQF